MSKKNKSKQKDDFPFADSLKADLHRNAFIYDRLFQTDRPLYVFGYLDKDGVRRVDSIFGMGKHFAHLNGVKKTDRKNKNIPKFSAPQFYNNCLHDQLQKADCLAISNITKSEYDLKVTKFFRLKQMFDDTDPIYVVPDYTQYNVKGKAALLDMSLNTILVLDGDENNLYLKSFQTKNTSSIMNNLIPVDFMYRVVTFLDKGEKVHKAYLVKGKEEDIIPYRKMDKFRLLMPDIEEPNDPGKLFTFSRRRNAKKSIEKASQNQYAEPKKENEQTLNPDNFEKTLLNEVNSDPILPAVGHPVLLIVGKSGTGKDRAADILRREFDYTKIISYTTRPKRSENENNHIFISKKEAAAYTSRIASTQINGHEYFATYQQLKDNQIYIVDPAGLKELTSRMPDQEFHLLYLRADEEATKAKAIQRSDDPVKEAQVYEKRKASEAQQFSEFEQMFMTDSLPENVVKSVSVFNGYNRLFENSLIDAIRKDLAFEKAMFQSQRLELDEIEQDNDLEI